MENTITFMNRVESVQKEKRITQKELGGELKLRRPSLSDWKKNGSVPAGDICIKISHYLNVSVEWLISGKEETLTNEEKKLIAQWKLLTPEQADTIRTLLVKWESDRFAREREKNNA